MKRNLTISFIYSLDELNYLAYMICLVHYEVCITIMDEFILYKDQCHVADSVFMVLLSHVIRYRKIQADHYQVCT